jgi:hypothetical protein
MSNVIELSENSIQILDVQKLTDRHVMIVKVDVGNLPPSKAMDFMECIRVAFSEKVAPAELIVMPLTNEINVFEKD